MQDLVQWLEVLAQLERKRIEAAGEAHLHAVKLLSKHLFCCSFGEALYFRLNTVSEVTFYYFKICIPRCQKGSAVAMLLLKELRGDWKT